MKATRYGENSHTVAATVTADFLDFSARRGNNLRSAGVTNNCRWCLCASRWKEAYDAYKAGIVSADTVPRVNLDATHERALGVVTFAQLEEFADGKVNDMF